MIWDVHPESGFFSIPNPEFRDQKGTASRIRIRNAANYYILFIFFPTFLGGELLVDCTRQRSIAFSHFYNL
jgi:hypothetical protein